MFIHLPRPVRRLAPAAAALAFVVLAVPGEAAPGAPSAPAPDTWPVPDLVTDIRDTLTQYYGQRATSGTPYYELAPEFEQDKRDAKKDPDTLWEYHGGLGTRCHTATIDVQFINCTGQRLASTYGQPYTAVGVPALFDAARGFYANMGYALTAGYYGLYHAFAHDFDAPCADPCAPGPGQTQRDSETYHKRMLRAYEAHMRDILLRMFRDTRANGQFQFDVTRSAGLMASTYLRLVEAMEEYDAWAPATQDRRKALALVNALNQRLWYEWVLAQPNGPRTAGFADIGSRKTYDAAVAANPGVAGTHQFNYGGMIIESLRPASQDTPGGPWDGFWFDADYSLPGEFFCGYRFPVGSEDYLDCLDHAGRQSLNGTKSPYGQFYGPAGCASRGGPNSCGQVNLGSIAEEWMWSFAGARAGMFLMSELAKPDPVHHPGGPDPDLPAGAVGPNGEYQTVTDRLGYGISGWHGGDPYNDDLEWTWNQPPGTAQRIRTLSAGRHDAEAQSGQYSLGENEPPGSSALKGDLWSVGLQRGEEFPGGMENHMPGPNPPIRRLAVPAGAGRPARPGVGRAQPVAIRSVPPQPSRGVRALGVAHPVEPEPLPGCGRSGRSQLLRPGARPRRAGGEAGRAGLPGHGRLAQPALRLPVAGQGRRRRHDLPNQRGRAGQGLPRRQGWLAMAAGVGSEQPSWRRGGTLPAGRRRIRRLQRAGADPGRVAAGAGRALPAGFGRRLVAAGLREAA